MAAALLLTGCGKDSAPPEDALGRYCDLAAQLDQAAVATGVLSPSGAFDGPTDAIGTLMAQVEPTLEELKSAAPKKIRGDVKKMVDGLEKAKAGDLAAIRSPEFTAASKNTQAFRLASCRAGGAGAGDG